MAKNAGGRFGWTGGLALFLIGALTSAVYFGWQMFTLTVNEYAITSARAIILQTEQATPLETRGDIEKERLVISIMHDAFPSNYCQARADLTKRTKAARLQKGNELTGADFDALEQLLAKMDRPGKSAVVRWNGLWFGVEPATVETCDAIMARQPTVTYSAVNFNGTPEH